MIKRMNVETFIFIFILTVDGIILCPATTLLKWKNNAGIEFGVLRDQEIDTHDDFLSLPTLLPHFLFYTLPSFSRLHVGMMNFSAKRETGRFSREWIILALSSQC